MSDAPGVVSGGDGGQGGDGRAAVAAGTGGDGGVQTGTPIAPREWMGNLPDDLKGDATLGRYENIEALARGHLETKKSLSKGLVVPAADAPADDWGKVWNALGRPESADGYDFGENDALDEATIGAFKPVAHEIGLTQAQAARLAQFDLERMAAAEAQLKQVSEADLKTLQDDLGPAYEAQRQKASAAFTRIFGEDAAGLAEQLDGLVGSRKLVEGFMQLADLIGETGRVDGAGNPITAASDAEAEGKLNTLMQDAGWRKRINDGDAQAKAEHDRLLEAARRHASRGVFG